MTVTPSGEFVYVANNGSKNVSAFSLNSNGELTRVTNSPFTAGTKPAAVAVDPSSKFVYVANNGSNSVFAYTIDSTTGELTAVAGGAVATGTKPAAVTVDPSGRFVFIRNATPDDISCFSLNSSTGVLTALVPGPTQARKSPASLVVSSGSSAITYTPTYAYVADFSGGVPTLSVNAGSGSLEAITGSPFGSGSPRTVAVAPNRKFVYAANKGGTDNMIGEYMVDATTGALSSVGTIATGNSPYDVTVDPSSRFVYAVAISTNAVYAYKINESTGALTKISGSPYTVGLSSPDSLAVDPTGRFLTATTGALTLHSTYPAGGAAPWGISTDVTGKYVYMTSNDDTIYEYDVDNSSGNLTNASGSPTMIAAGASRGIVTDPSGQFLYITNSEQALGYSINASPGALTELSSSPYAAGGDPLGITLIGTIQ